MANKFQKFLGSVAMGFLAPKGNMADFQHAARLYVDDTFRLAPKNKFLYYVVFNINPDALDDVGFEDRHMLELNYLVKAAELPKYTIKTDTLNQYNRKTNVYTNITYEPVTISLHDDNNGVTNLLWALYYGYYFADGNNARDPGSEISPVAYDRNTYNSKNRIPFRYGLDNDSDEPFFNSIQLFTLSRQRFFSYLLCNPKITKWDHDGLDQSSGNGILENRMTLAYDAVIYNSGVVEEDDPAGFAVLHYDKTPSPIADEIGFRNGIAGIFGDVFSMNRLGGGAGGLVGGFISGLVKGLAGGNQKPYGYGQPTFIGRGTPSIPYSTSGFQQYGFGGLSNQVGLTGALTIAGVGLAANAVGNVISGVGSLFRSSQENPSRTVQAPNGESPTSEDIYGAPTPPRRPDNLDAGAGAGRGSTVEGLDDRAKAQAEAQREYDELNKPEPGYSGEAGEILNDNITPAQSFSSNTGNDGPVGEDTRGSNTLPSAGETPNTSASEFGSLDYVDTQTNDTQNIIDAQSQMQGNDEFSVGSAFG